MKGALCIAVVLVGAVVPAGCSSMDAALAPDFASKGITSVAVVHVVGELKGEAGINQVADMFAMEFMRKGYKVVERQQAVAVLKEQAGKLPAASYDAQAVFVGKLLGVDGVIVVNIPKFDRSMNLTAKMLDVKDGGVLWISYGTAETGETGSTIAGAVIGGVGGAVLGGGGDASVVGGVAGGALGGVVGNALSPQKADKLKKLIGKMCNSVPGP